MSGSTGQANPGLLWILKRMYYQFQLSIPGPFRPCSNLPALNVDLGSQMKLLAFWPIYCVASKAEYIKFYNK
jgi:hypothetical protein